MKKKILAEGLDYDNKVLYVDLNKWTTQAKLTKKLEVKRNVINNRIKRAVAAGIIKTYYIEQLGITLIPNVNNINELSLCEKKE